MNMSGKDRLNTLLFGQEGQELVNVKFFAGTKEGLTADELADAGAQILECVNAAWIAGEASRPPVSGREQCVIA